MWHDAPVAALDVQVILSVGVVPLYDVLRVDVIWCDMA